MLVRTRSSSWIVSIVVLLLVPAPVHAASTAVAVQRTELTFEVSNPQQLGEQHTIHGYEVTPRTCQPSTVVFLQHGLSYTGEAWDFLPREGYSYARDIAAAGYAVVAIDRLGYGRSALDNGYDITIEAYADIAHQIVVDLRARFDHVVMGGHSAGAEVSELAAGSYGDVDALIPMGYHHFPSQELSEDFFTGDVPRALQDDYEYFLGSPEHREEMFYTAEADPDVVAADTAAAVLTPSGEILSIGEQPSRNVLPLIDVPVFLQFAEGDRLFPIEFAEDDATLFAGAPSVTVDVVPGAGHTYMLHHAGPAAAQRIVEWLTGLEAAPACSAGESDLADGGRDEAGEDQPTTSESAGREALPATGGSSAIVGILVLAAGLRARRRAS